MVNNPYMPYNGYNNPFQIAAQQVAQQVAQNPITQNRNAIIWVQGKAGAQSYYVPANQSVLLMDSEEPCFYIKSSDASGMPLPLRVFNYSERVETTENHQTATDGASPDSSVLNEYATKDQVSEMVSAELAKVVEEMRNELKNMNEVISSIQITTTKSAKKDK